MLKPKIHRFLLVGFVTIFIPFQLLALDKNATIPAICKTTANVNVRDTCDTSGNIKFTLPPGRQLKVWSLTENGWAEIDYFYTRGYCHTDYIEFVKPMPPQQTAIPGITEDSRLGQILKWKIWRWLMDFAISCFVLYLIQRFLLLILGVVSEMFYRGYLFISFPFYVLNMLQRHLARPWIIFFKKNRGTESENKKKRRLYERLTIPLYILLTPLRFINAVYYNLFVHCLFELFNYLIEILVPSNEFEGGSSFIVSVLMLPWRIAKYLLWHGSLTLAESLIWTVVDTFVPALTLYHGTSCSAAESITQGPGRVCAGNKFSGVWRVGSGNFAGNGIYFAPARSTAIHYSSGSLIVCRVSLGRTLELGMAPRHVYEQCGHANALGATEWGLENGYVTGEWWRADCHWWEYCMYDWKNRYNHSWRIRPLYVIDLDDDCIQRIPGGMVHWLFRPMVISDLYRHLNDLRKSF